MNKIKILPTFLILGLVMGFGIFVTAKAVSAQNDNSSTNTQKRHDDDDFEEANQAGESDEADEHEDESDEADASAEEQAKLASQAKISKERATEIALAKVPGEVIESEIEKEDGKLIWSFDIKKADGTIFDVEIDANTGKVLKAEKDNDEDDSEDGDGNGNMSAVTGALISTVGGFTQAASSVFGFFFGN